MFSKTTSIQKDILRTLMPPMVIEEIKSPLTGWKGSGMLWVGRVAKVENDRVFLDQRKTSP